MTQFGPCISSLFRASNAEDRLPPWEAEWRGRIHIGGLLCLSGWRSREYKKQCCFVVSCSAKMKGFVSLLRFTVYSVFYFWFTSLLFMFIPLVYLLADGFKKKVFSVFQCISYLLLRCRENLQLVPNASQAPWKQERTVRKRKDGKWPTGSPPPCLASRAISLGWRLLEARDRFADLCRFVWVTDGSLQREWNKSASRHCLR